jgi:hypothetical protein
MALFKFLERLVRFNVRVIIFDVRYGGMKVRFDKGKAINDEEFDIPEYVLKSRRDISIKPPSLQYISRDDKGNDTLFLMQIERDKFIPILPPNVSPEPKFLAKLEEDALVSTWNRIKKKQKMLAYTNKSFWEKYGDIISLTFVGGLILFALIFTTQFIQHNIIAQGDRVANSLDNLVNKLNNTELVIQGSHSTNTRIEPSPTIHS